MILTQESPPRNTPREYLGIAARKHQPLRAALDEGLARYHVRFGMAANYVKVSPARLSDLGDVDGLTIAGDPQVATNELHIGRVSA